MTVASDISVVISTRDRVGPLERCLQSLRAGRSTPAEIVIVDQSADDATAKLASSSQAGVAPIVYLRHHGRGLGASQNAGVTRANRPIVAVIDDDCVADTDWLATISRAFEADPALDVVTGRVLPLEPVGDRVMPVSSRTSEVRREFAGKAAPWHVGSGNNFALRREAFLAIGGCDERLGPGAPAQGGVDMDLFYRLLRSGARIRYEPDSIVHHERQTKAERLGRRPMYGRGTGAAISLWLKQGDLYAVRLLGEWTLLRGGMAARAAGRGDWERVREEITMLGGTVLGLVQGMAMGKKPGISGPRPET